MGLSSSRPCMELLIPWGLLLGHQGESDSNSSPCHGLGQGELPSKGSRGATLVPSMVSCCHYPVVSSLHALPTSLNHQG